MNAKLEEAIRALAEAERRFNDAKVAADQLGERGYQSDEQRTAIINAVFESEHRRDKAVTAVIAAFAEPDAGSAEAVELRTLLRDVEPYLAGYEKLLSGRPEFSAPHLPSVIKRVAVALRQPLKVSEPYVPRAALK